LTLVLFCGMCFTADFVIVSLKTFQHANKTHDLILTNHHGKVIRTDTIPGISDHDIVYTEFDLRPVKLQHKPRTIPLYNKANWFYVCPEFFYSRVWFFLDYRVIFWVRCLSCLYFSFVFCEDRPAKHQTHLIKYVQGQWLPSNQYVECL
jgi:hypothetical protein